MPVPAAAKLVGRAVEHAAVEWVIAYEHRAGRHAVDRRFDKTFSADLESTGQPGEHRLIETIKASGTSYRGWFLPFEPVQFHAAGSDQIYYVYVVENVGQGNPAAFTLRVLDAAHLGRLKERYAERHYFEVSWPSKDYDSTPPETLG